MEQPEYYHPGVCSSVYMKKTVYLSPHVRVVFDTNFLSVYCAAFVEHKSGADWSKPEYPDRTFTTDSPRNRKEFLDIIIKKLEENRLC